MLTVFGIGIGVLMHRFRLLQQACETWVAALASAPFVLMYPLFMVIFGRNAWTIIMMGFVSALPPVILKTIEGISGTRKVLVNVGRSFNLTATQQFWKILFPAALPTIFVGIRLGLIFALINIVGTEFLINYGGLGQLIEDLAERYDLAGTYAAICFVILVSVLFFMALEKSRAMAETGRLVRAHVPLMSPVTLLRVAIILGALALWEFLAHSGWLYRDVVPSLLAIGRALYGLLASPDFWFNLGVTAGEIGVALAIGSLAGLALGLLLGVNRFLSRAYEPYLYYLGPTPKIIFFPIMIMWFGVGVESKIALGALSCFFPVVLSVAAGMRANRQGADPRRRKLPRQPLADGDEDLSAGHAPSDHQRRAAGPRLCADRHAAGGDQTVEQRRRLSDHPGLQHFRHAAHVRHADRAVRAGDRRQRPGRPPWRSRQHQAHLVRRRIEAGVFPGAHGFPARP